MRDPAWTVPLDGQFFIIPAHNRIVVKVTEMPETDIKDAITEKSMEIKKMFKEMSATLEQWKFSIEDTKEGTRVEIHATALIKRNKE
jgi:hypothetical protein